MSAVLANLAAADAGPGRRAAAARRHRHGPDAISSSSAPPSAASAAASTPRSRGSPATMPTGSCAEGKEVKILCVGKKGRDALRRLFAKQILEVRRPPRGQAARLRRRRRDRPRRCWSCSTKASSTSRTLFYAEFQSVITQIPTAQQLIPARDRRTAPTAPAAARSTSTSRTRRRSSPTCCRATLGPDLPRAARERGVGAGRPDDARWTTPRATPAT